MTSTMNSVVYRDGKRLGEIAVDDISEVIKQPGTFVWLELQDPDDLQLRKIQEEFGLHELAQPVDQLRFRERDDNRRENEQVAAVQWIAAPIQHQPHSDGTGN